MKFKYKKNNKPNGIRRIFTGILFYTSLFFLIILLVFQLFPVQTWLARQVASSLSARSSYTIEIDKLRVSWLNEIEINQVFIGANNFDTLLYSDNIKVKYWLVNYLRDSFLTIDEIVGTEIKINYQKSDSLEGFSNINDFIHSISSSQSDTSNNANKTLALKITDLSLNSLLFNIETEASKPKIGLDANSMNWSFDAIEFSELEFLNDTIGGNILNLIGSESNSGFKVNNVKSSFKITNQSLSVDDLEMSTPYSFLTDSLEFFYNGFDDFSYFIDSVSFILYFEEAVIGYRDIEILTGNNTIKSNIGLDGIVWGTVGDFNIEDSKIEIGASSYLQGGVSGFGLPDLEKTFLLADLTDAIIDPNDFIPYIEKETIDRINNTFGEIDFNGSFAGYLNDFVARGEFVTNQGEVKTDINLVIPEKLKDLKYKGSLEVIGLDFRNFFKDEYVGSVNLIGTIDGQGIEQNNAKFDLNALMYSSEFNGYSYDSIKADGNFSDQFFNGTYEVIDENASLNGSAQLDFTTDNEILKVSVEIDTINTQPLNFSNQNIAISSTIDLDIYDLDLNSFNGSLTIDSTRIVYQNKFLNIDSVNFFAATIDSIRIFNLSFPGLETRASGVFKLTDVLNDIPAIVQRYKKKLMIDSDSTQLSISDIAYKIDFGAQAYGLNRYFESLGIPFKLGTSTFLEASYRKSKNSNISVLLESDAVAIGKSEFLFPTIDINSSTGLRNDEELTSVIVESVAQLFDGVPPTKDFFLEAVWNNRQIDVTSSVKQDKTHSDIRVKTHVDLIKDSLIIKFNDSDIKLFDKYYEFDPDNKILVMDHVTEILDMRISDVLGESIGLYGVISDTSITSLTLKTDHLNINKVDLFTTSNLNGLLDSRMSVFRTDDMQPYRFEGEFFLEGLRYKDLFIGDLKGSSQWLPEEKSVFSEIEVNRENFKTIAVEGQYFPNDTINQFDYIISFDQADLKLGDAFLEGNFSDLDGYADGKLLVTGNANTPVVFGNCSLNGQFTVDYLNTHYKINGTIGFDEDEIALDRMILIDRKGGSSSLTGRLLHNYFDEFETDFLLTTENFEFLNTTRIDNNLYYGSAYGSGSIKVSGPFNALSIVANVKTENNTNFFIPISESATVQQESYISFINFLDTLEMEEEEEFILGLNLDFRIEITPEAYCELIFDEKTGDIIKGRGNGNLRLSMSSDGEFSMFGPLTIEEGSYNFTMANLISKEFAVSPGSSLTWYGDPYNGNLDMEAYYLQRASFFPLDSTRFQNPNDKIPLKVLLNLGGGMLSPDINFDIEFVNESDATDDEISELEIITGDDQELNRQFISLVFLRKFSPKESFALGGGGNIGDSFGEFLSNQMSYLFSQLDENLEFELDLASLDNETFNTLQLRLAYTFLNGRLKVTRGGDFNSQNDSNGSVLTSIVGDWSFEYSITKDNKLRIKVFQTTNEQLTFNNGQQAMETGISLKFVHSFNTFMELLKLKRDQSKTDKDTPNTF